MECLNTLVEYHGSWFQIPGRRSRTGCSTDFAAQWQQHKSLTPWVMNIFVLDTRTKMWVWYSDPNYSKDSNITSKCLTLLQVGSTVTLLCLPLLRLRRSIWIDIPIDSWRRRRYVRGSPVSQYAPQVSPQQSPATPIFQETCITSMLQAVSTGSGIATWLQLHSLVQKMFKAFANLLEENHIVAVLNKIRFVATPWL